MSNAYRKKLAALEKKHGHQIHRDSNTRYNKDILIAGKNAYLSLKTTPIQMIC